MKTCNCQGFRGSLCQTLVSVKGGASYNCSYELCLTLIPMKLNVGLKEVGFPRSG